MPDLPIEFHLLNPNGTYRCPLPAVGGFDLSLELNSPGKLDIEYPVVGENWAALHEFVPGKGAAQLAIWPLGQSTGALRAILLNADTNDVAESKTIKYSGFFYEYRLIKAVVWNQPAPAEKGELRFTSQTGGAIVRTMMQQAQARGTLTGITFASFTNSVDSNGVSWPTVANIKFSPGMTYLAAFQKLSEAGLCDFEMRGPELRLYASGTRGTDLTLTTGVTFQAGRDLTEAPRKYDAQERVSALLVAGDEGVYSNVSDATAQAQIGWREEGFASQNGLTDATTVQAWAQTRLQIAKVPDEELTAALSFGDGSPQPIRDFNLGDWVWADTTGVKERVRVAQIVVSRGSSDEDLSGSVVLGDRVDDALVKLAKKLAAYGDGSAVVGTSTADPGAGGEDTVPPKAPTGLVGSSIAYQDDVSADTQASVTVSWNAVTEDVNNVAETVSGYRVRYAYVGLNQVGGIPSSDPFPENNLSYYEATGNEGTPNTTFTFADVGAGADIRVQVAAFDSVGNLSAWSNALTFTTAVDNTPPPVTSTPTVATWFGTVKITWNGLGSAGEAMPVDFDHVEVHLSTANNFTPTTTTLQARLYAAGTWNAVDLTYGTGYYARLVSVDRAGNKAAASATSTVATPEQLVSQDLINGIIDATKLSPNSVQSSHIVNLAATSAKIADAAIITAKIADLAVNNAKIADLSVGKLTAGTMTADVLLSGIIRTALSGARVEMDAAGVRLYNTAGTLTARLQASDGSVLVTGTYQSALTGERINIFTDGTLRFYPSAGTNYSQIANFGNDVVWRGPLDSNGRSGRINVNVLGVGLNFSAESEIPNNLRAEIALFDRRVRVTSPYINLQLDGQYSTTDGVIRRVAFSQTNSSGAELGTSLIEYKLDSSGNPGMVAVNGGKNAGWKAEATQMLVVNGAMTSFVPCKASAFPVGSSAVLKEQIEDVRALLDPLQVIRSARARRYILKADKWRTPAPTEGNPHPEPEPVSDPPVSVGVIAEDLPAALQVMSPSADGTGMELSVDLAKQYAVLWGALNQIQDQQLLPASAVAALPSRLMANTDYDVTVPWADGPTQTVPAPVSLTPMGPTSVQLRALTVRVVATTKTGVTVRFRAKRLVASLDPEDHYVVNALYLFQPPYVAEAA